MYARLSPPTQRVLVFAEGYSRESGRAEVDVDALLAGVLVQRDPVRDVLTDYGVTRETVAATVGVGAPRDASTSAETEHLVVATKAARRGRGLPRWADAAKAALQSSLVYAVDEGREISTRDLVLGILDLASSAADEVWQGCGVDKAELREALLRTR